MLNHFFTDPIALGIAQALCAGVFALGVAFAARRSGIHLARETVISLIRGLIQIIVVGSVLVFVFGGNQWLNVVILLIMMLAGAYIASERTKAIDRPFRITLTAIFVGAGLIIGVMVFLGVIDTASISLIPVGSIIINNAMNTSALALDRFRVQIEAHTGLIETGLALGASPNTVVAPYVRDTVRASMLPSINNMRSLGIVWIPGVMAGLLLAGSDPLSAALYQFVVVSMMFSIAATTSLLTTLLVRSHVFTKAEQLILRPQAESERPMGG
ncbi:MAG: ABC transporter permease [Anaerolineae bacterium]|nr:ABC transporter permease [Anaerolineae bacterium]